MDNEISELRESNILRGILPAKQAQYMGRYLAKDGAIIKHYSTLIEREWPENASKNRKIIYKNYKKNIEIRDNMFKTYFSN